MTNLPGTETCVVEGVYKSFGQGAGAMTVLRGIDFRAAPGECVFLLGPSGSGKTTLLSIMGCMLRPDAGRVCLLGNEVTRMTEPERNELRRDRIGFIFQRFHLVRGLSALENTIVPLLIRGCPTRQAKERGLRLLDEVGLADRAKENPGRMSIGQQQRIALARALVNDPEIVLADEPTSSLDAETGQSAMRLLRRLTVEAGRTAIVVTHDPRIESFADRVLRMENGRLLPTHREAVEETAAANQLHATPSELQSAEAL
jgi:putative ABC transport system ATP-binding protein